LVQANASIACNARVLTAYESQLRLRRDFLEGARKKRVSYTFRGLWEAWSDLDAAMKVYVGSIAGLILSVHCPLRSQPESTAHSHSSYPLSCSFLARVVSMTSMVSLGRHRVGSHAAEVSNGWCQPHQARILLIIVAGFLLSLCNYFGRSL
jgi:hypothetical protein